MATIVKSFDDYVIGDKIRKVLRADRIEYLGMQVFKKDRSNILKWFNHINNEGNTQFANYIEDEDDEQEILSGNLKTAVELGELTDVPEIEIKPKAVEVGNMTELAISASFSRKFLKDDANFETFNRTMEKLAASLLFVIKERAFHKIITHAKAPTVNLEDGEWTEGNDHIDNDLYHIITAFENQKQGMFSLTNLITSKRAMNAMRRYYRTVDGSFNPNDILPNEGVKRAVESIPQLEEGLIGIDVSDNPCALFYNIDPDHNVYNKTPEQSFINVIIDDSNMKGQHPHSLTVEMFVEFGFGIMNPNALLYQPGV